VRAAPRHLRRLVEQVPGRQGRPLVRQLDVVSQLHSPRVLPQARLVENQVVADPEFGLHLTGEQSFVALQSQRGRRRLATRLPVEQVDDRLYGRELERLVAVELELHGRTRGSATTNRFEAPASRGIESSLRGEGLRQL
jgi:hypothetical protein